MREIGGGGEDRIRQGGETRKGPKATRTSLETRGDSERLGRDSDLGLVIKDRALEHEPGARHRLERARERGRERKGGGEKEREREGEKERVGVRCERA